MMSYSEQIDITPLKKAASVFERFRVDMMDDRDQAGAEQAFEFCFELSWKFLMKILNKKSVNVASPKDTIRAALKNNLIKDADLWMEFLKMRNLTSHVYLEEYLAQVIEIFDQFSLALNELIKTLDEVLKND